MILSTLNGVGKVLSKIGNHDNGHDDYYSHELNLLKPFISFMS